MAKITTPETLQEFELFLDEIGELLENPKTNKKEINRAIQAIDQFLNDYDEYLAFQDELFNEIAALVIEAKAQKLITNWKLQEAIKELENWEK